MYIQAFVYILMFVDRANVIYLGKEFHTSAYLTSCIVVYSNSYDDL